MTDVEVGLAVIARLEKAGITRKELMFLVQGIKRYYQISSMQAIVQRWVSSDYSQRMRTAPDSVSIEEFIGHACNLQSSNTLAAFQAYKNFGSSNKYFRYLLGAMLEQTAPSNLFLGSKEVLAYKKDLRKFEALQIAKSSDSRLKDQKLIEDIKKYEKHYTSRKYRKEKFFVLAEQVARALNVNEPRHFGVTDHGRAVEVNRGDVNLNEIDHAWEALLPTLTQVLSMYETIYFVEPDKWPLQDKRDFTKRVYSKDLQVVNMGIIGDQRANTLDEEEGDDPDSISLVEVFMAPQELLKKWMEREDTAKGAMPQDEAGPSSSSLNFS